MPVITPVTTIQAGSIFETLPDSVDVFVAADVALVSTNGLAISDDSSNHQVTVAGLVQGGITAIKLGDAFSQYQSNLLVVQDTGIVQIPMTTNGAAVHLCGTGTILQNAGFISGSIGVAFVAQGDDPAVMENAGRIIGKIGVQRLELFGSATLINTGTILGTEYSYNGTALSNGFNGQDKIINRGRMEGTISLGGDNDQYDGSGGGVVIGTIRGDDGRDRFFLGAKAEVINGGNDLDTVDYGKAKSGILLALDGSAPNSGWAKGDSFTSIEIFRGSAHNDTIKGGSAGDILMGGAGVDVIQGGAGANLLAGGAARIR